MGSFPSGSYFDFMEMEEQESTAMKKPLLLDTPFEGSYAVVPAAKTGISVAGKLSALALAAVLSWSSLLQAATTVTHPYVGITEITQTETVPRKLNMHIVKVDLTAPGINFKLTPAGVNLPAGTATPTVRETVRQITLDYLNQEHAQVAINSHFFLPFPTTESTSNLIGLAVSNGNIYSPFEAPVQSYAIVTNSPAINIDPNNIAGIVHADTSYADGKHITENTTLWNAFAGSAQIITNGVVTVPEYKDATHPNGLLTTNSTYKNSNSWYNVLNPRTVSGLSQDNKTLFIFTVDKAGGSLGMTGSEVANFLISNYGVYNALNLDGGGSTTLVMQDPATNVGTILNLSSNDAPGNPRAEGSNIAIFAMPVSNLFSATTGNFVYNRATRLYTGNLIITNNGADFTGILDVALNNLTSDVTLTNAIGQRNNAPYVNITNSGLAVGASLTIPLSFSNPTNAKINFTPVEFQE
jgi:exopolysaccharide biosynthesis protein